MGGIPDGRCPGTTLGLHENRAREKTRQSAGEQEIRFPGSASGAQFVTIMHIRQRSPRRAEEAPRAPSGRERPPGGGARAPQPAGPSRRAAGSALLTRRATPREDGAGRRRHGRWAALRLGFRHDGRTQRQAAAGAGECKGQAGHSEPGARSPGGEEGRAAVRVRGGRAEPGLRKGAGGCVDEQRAGRLPGRGGGTRAPAARGRRWAGTRPRAVRTLTRHLVA